MVERVGAQAVAGELERLEWGGAGGRGEVWARGCSSARGPGSYDAGASGGGKFEVVAFGVEAEMTRRTLA